MVYAINPFRTLLLVLFQALIPELIREETNPEYYRNILSASIQLLSATLIWRLRSSERLKEACRTLERGVSFAQMSQKASFKDPHRDSALVFRVRSAARAEVYDNATAHWPWHPLDLGGTPTI